MIETSILSRLTGDLCDAVTGRSGGAETLVRLERSNAFVIPLDRDDRWYRYHHLFGDLVAAELQRTRPDEERPLHQRAFEWLRDAGEVADAIGHGLAAGEVDAAADLLAENNFPMMNSGRAETARALVASFPPEKVADHQPFAVAAAGINAMTGHSEAARRWLAVAEKPRPMRARDRTGWRAPRSSIGLVRGSLAPDGVDAALADGRRRTRARTAAAARLDARRAPCRTLARHAGRRRRSDRVPRGGRAQRMDQHTGLRDGRALARASSAAGTPRRALATANLARALIHEAGGDDLFMAATAQAATALAAIDLGDERAARVALRAAHRPMAGRRAGDADGRHPHSTPAGPRRARARRGRDRPGLPPRCAKGHRLDQRCRRDAGRARRAHGAARRAPTRRRRPPMMSSPSGSSRSSRMLPSPLTTREIGERALRLAQHDQDPPAADLPQTQRLVARGSCPDRPRSRIAPSGQRSTAVVQLTAIRSSPRRAISMHRLAASQKELAGPQKVGNHPGDWPLRS